MTEVGYDEEGGVGVLFGQVTDYLWCILSGQFVTREGRGTCECAFEV